MFKYLILMGCVLFSASIYAEESEKIPPEKKECTLAFEAIRSPLKNDLLKFKQIQIPVRNAEFRTVNQTAVMKNGEIVEFQGGGCQKLTYSLIYSNLNLGSGDVWENIPVAIEMLESTSMENEIKMMFLAALKKAKQKKTEKVTVLPLICGADQCSMEKENSKIKLSFTAR